jgi:hypothetical protein
MTFTGSTSNLPIAQLPIEPITTTLSTNTLPVSLIKLTLALTLSVKILNCVFLNRVVSTALTVCVNILPKLTVLLEITLTTSTKILLCWKPYCLKQPQFPSLFWFCFGKDNPDFQNFGEQFADRSQNKVQPPIPFL